MTKDLRDRRDLGGNVAGDTLKDSEFRLRQATEVAELGTYDYYPQTGQLLWSDRAKRHFGLSPDAHVTYDVFLAGLHPDDRDRVHQTLQKSLRSRSGEPFADYTSECRTIGIEDKQERWLTTRWRAFYNEASQAVRITGTTLDITDRKVAESRLQELNRTLERRIAERTAVAEHRALQLQRLAGELSRVEEHERRRLARVLHDHLQQLLVGAKFSISMLRGQVHDDGLRQSLTQVNDLLNDSITASRSLTVELSPPILSQGNLAAALHWLAQWMEEKHELVTEIRAADEANPQDDSTRNLLFQAVRELLLNVVKHAGVKRAIVETHLTDDGHVRITVADTGVGFDPARIGRGHDPLTGYGLFNLQERLSLLGGRLLIDSAPGAGARVTLLAPVQPVVPAPDEAILPVAEPSLTASHRMEVLRRRTHGKAIRVLLADDHDVVRNGLARLLQTQPGIQVIAQASDGQMAVDLALRAQPDVIVMDVSMPRLDGVEATRRITSQLPGAKIIGLSMHGEGEVADRMRQAGAVTYLAKSSAPEDLVAAIRSCKPDAAPAAPADS
jgi:PAS domain S-box-containing protein